VQAIYLLLVALVESLTSQAQTFGTPPAAEGRVAQRPTSQWVEIQLAEMAPA
jgi:hypothetical protein